MGEKIEYSSRFYETTLQESKKKNLENGAWLELRWNFSSVSFLFYILHGFTFSKIGEKN